MTQFILNQNLVRTDLPPGLLVLDYVRHHHRLIGTKEGCKEGDCGACTVLIGEFDGSNVRYMPVTSCLMPLGELHGKHLVTIEGLNLSELTPVQQAIVDEGATQCGFCTSGIVVSLTAYLMQDGVEIDLEGVKMALSGHLCRCTGYRSLKAGTTILQERIGSQTGIANLVQAGLLPVYFLEIAATLAEIPAPATDFHEHGGKRWIAGGTDLYVQRGEELPDETVGVLNLNPKLKGIARQNGHLRVGALTTFEEFAHDPEVVRLIPQIDTYMHLIASWQIRNRATLGGNIINASPIGDMTVLLLAMQCTLVLEKGSERRTVPMTEFYRGYKQMDRAVDEILTEIQVPLPATETQIHFEKVSKRKCLDIASVNSAICIRVEDDTIREIGLAVGGVAPIPLFLRETCGFLSDRRLSPETLREAFKIAQSEISPIDDVRGSAAYKRLLTRQLLRAHFVELFDTDTNVLLE